MQDQTCLHVNLFSTGGESQPRFVVCDPTERLDASQDTTQVNPTFDLQPDEEFIALILPKLKLKRSIVNIIAQMIGKALSQGFSAEKLPLYDNWLVKWITILNTNPQIVGALPKSIGSVLYDNLCKQGFCLQVPTSMGKSQPYLINQVNRLTPFLNIALRSTMAGFIFVIYLLLIRQCCTS